MSQRLDQPERCEICGEEIQRYLPMAEMYDPKQPELDSKICHAECGLNAGLDIA